ncbi:hypothetical protein GW17_00048922 [Ensete ventricosum]|nr:hypothetical protein GW17_00048922 [Ensete ventricosum]
MVASGMVEELGRYFAEEAEAEAGKSRHPGLDKAIGVSEFREYFRGDGRGTEAAYEAAVVAIKANTRRLAEQQTRKIEQLVELGWPLRRLDATAAVLARLSGSASAEAEAAWEKHVACPSAVAVEHAGQSRAEQSSGVKSNPNPTLLKDLERETDAWLVADLRSWNGSGRSIIIESPMQPRTDWKNRLLSCVLHRRMMREATELGPKARSGVCDYEEEEEEEEGT